MDWRPYILIGLSGLLVLFVGLILLSVWHWMKLRQQSKMKAFLARDLIFKVKRLMVEGLAETMDLMPEKVMETKRILDEE